MKFKKTKKLISSFFSIVLVICLIAGSVALISSIKNDNYKTIYLSYKNGNISKTGASSEDNSAIYSDEFECKGLTITPAFDSKVDYTVFFYDDDGEFVSNTTKMSKESKEDIVPLTAKKARIVLTFKNSIENEDGKIGILEILDIQNDIKVKVFKNQNVKMLNIFKQDKDKKDYKFSTSVNQTISDKSYVSSDGYNCSDLIGVSAYTKIKITLHYNPGTFKVMLIDSNKKIIRVSEYTFTESDSVYVQEIDISDCKFIAFDYQSAYGLPEVYPVE